jgi:competence protein ComEC
MKSRFTKWLLVFLLIFVPLYLFRLNHIPEYQISEDKPVRIIGRIAKQPYLKGSKQIIQVGPIIVQTERFPGYFYGQKIEIIGELKKQVIDPLQTRYWAYYPVIHIVGEEKNDAGFFNWRRFLLSTRSRLEKRLNQGFNEPYSSLINGILLGVKREMPQDFWQKLRKTGTLHVVVASGQNLSILAKFLMVGLVWGVGRRKALFLAFLGVVLYILMVGAEAPVVRAGIMVGVAFLAQFLGREEEATLALVVAAVLMLLISPLILFDIGFQLSFAATAGIIWLYPWFKEKRVFTAPVFGEALATTLAAQVGVTPIILVNFGQVSFLAPLVNGLILWTVPLLMVLGGAIILIGLVFSPLAQALAWLTWPLLAYFVGTVELFGKLPWIAWEVGKISGWWIMGYYLVLAFLVLRLRKHGRI